MPRTAYTQDLGHEDGETDEEKDEEAGDTLLTTAEECWSFTWGGRFRLLLQGDDVIYGEDCGGDEPRNAQNRVGGYCYCHYEKVQMVASPLLKRKKSYLCRNR